MNKLLILCALIALSGCTAHMVELDGTGDEVWRYGIKKRSEPYHDEPATIAKLATKELVIQCEQSTGNRYQTTGCYDRFTNIAYLNSNWIFASTYEEQHEMAHRWGGEHLSCAGLYATRKSDCL